MHGEVTVKDGKFHISLLDEAMKPVALTNQTLTVTAGDRANPEKLEVEKEGEHFVAPTVKDGQWVILQFRADAAAKPITARFQYETSVCGECSKAEWLCSCAAETEKK
jgi:nitrogen fixation protein FixH